MRYYPLLLSAVVAVLLEVSSASAVTIIATRADCDAFRPNETTIDSGSALCGGSSTNGDASAVNLGTADDRFFSLGVGGSAQFMVFPSLDGGDGAAIEVSFGSTDKQEAARVFGSSDGMTFIDLGVVTNQGSSGGGSNSANVDFSGTYRYIGFHDISSSFFGPQSSSQISTTGFGIDSLRLVESSASPGTVVLPLPAPALLLLAALGGLGVVGARRRT